MDEQQGMEGSREEDAVQVEASGEGEEKDLAWLSGFISFLLPDIPTDSILVVKFKPETSDVLEPTEETQIDRTEKVRVHSELLIQCSPMFRKLYQTASEEKRGKEITISISSSDEAALAHMFHLVYDPCPSLLALPHSGVLLMGVIKLADMFEVAFCVAAACRSLLSAEIPMTLHVATSCLELQPEFKCVEETEPLVAAAREFLVESFRDIELHLSDPQLLNLPLPAIKAVLSSESLRMTEEDAIVRAASQWTKQQHLADDRDWINDVWSSEFSPLFRFACISDYTLDDFVGGLYCDPEFLQEAVFQASVFKAKVARNRLIGEEPPAMNYVDRGYCVPADVTVIGPPMEHCSAIVRLSRSQWRSLLRRDKEEIDVRAFWFSRRRISLRIRCNENDRLVVLFSVDDGGISVHLEVAVRDREADGAFKKILLAGQEEERIIGPGDRITLPFQLRVDDRDAPFFLDDVLFLRVDINIRQN